MVDIYGNHIGLPLKQRVQVIPIEDYHAHDFVEDESKSRVVFYEHDDNLEYRQICKVFRCSIHGCDAEITQNDIEVV